MDDNSNLAKDDGGDSTRLIAVGFAGACYLYAAFNNSPLFAIAGAVAMGCAVLGAAWEQVTVIKSRK